MTCILSGGTLNFAQSNPYTHAHAHTCTRTHTSVLWPTGLWDYPGELVPGPIWILLKQETVSGSGISWAICKSAPRLRQKTTPASHYWVLYSPAALPATQPAVSKHWRCHQSTNKQTDKFTVYNLQYCVKSRGL